MKRSIGKTATLAIVCSLACMLSACTSGNMYYQTYKLAKTVLDSKKDFGKSDKENKKEEKVIETTAVEAESTDREDNSLVDKEIDEAETAEAEKEEATETEEEKPDGKAILKKGAICYKEVLFDDGQLVVDEAFIGMTVDEFFAYSDILQPIHASELMDNWEKELKKKYPNAGNAYYSVPYNAIFLFMDDYLYDIEVESYSDIIPKDFGPFTLEEEYQMQRNYDRSVCSGGYNEEYIAGYEDITGLYKSDGGIYRMLYNGGRLKIFDYEFCDVMGLMDLSEVNEIEKNPASSKLIGRHGRQIDSPTLRRYAVMSHRYIDPRTMEEEDGAEADAPDTTVQEEKNENTTASTGKYSVNAYAPAEEVEYFDRGNFRFNEDGLTEVSKKKISEYSYLEIDDDGCVFWYNGSNQMKYGKVWTYQGGDDQTRMGWPYMLIFFDGESTPHEVYRQQAALWITGMPELEYIRYDGKIEKSSEWNYIWVEDAWHMEGAPN